MQVKERLAGREVPFALLRSRSVPVDENFREMVKQSASVSVQLKRLPRKSHEQKTGDSAETWFTSQHGPCVEYRQQTESQASSRKRRLAAAE